MQKTLMLKNLYMKNNSVCNLDYTILYFLYTNYIVFSKTRDLGTLGTRDVSTLDTRDLVHWHIIQYMTVKN